MIHSDEEDNNPNPWQWAQKIFNPQDFNELIDTTTQVFGEESQLVRMELSLTKEEVIDLVRRWWMACADDPKQQDFFADMMASYMAWLEDMLNQYHPDWNPAGEDDDDEEEDE